MKYVSTHNFINLWCLQVCIFRFFPSWLWSISQEIDKVGFVHGGFPTVCYLLAHNTLQTLLEPRLIFIVCEPIETKGICKSLYYGLDQTLNGESTCVKLENKFHTRTLDSHPIVGFPRITNPIYR